MFCNGDAGELVPFFQMVIKIYVQVLLLFALLLLRLITLHSFFFSSKKVSFVVVIGLVSEGPTKWMIYDGAYSYVLSTVDPPSLQTICYLKKL